MLLRVSNLRLITKSTTFSRTLTREFARILKITSHYLKLMYMYISLPSSISSLYQSLRTNIIDLVLATDISKHFEHLAKFENMPTEVNAHSFVLFFPLSPLLILSDSLLWLSLTHTSSFPSLLLPHMYSTCTCNYSFFSLGRNISIVAWEQIADSAYFSQMRRHLKCLSSSHSVSWVGRENSGGIFLTDWGREAAKPSRGLPWLWSSDVQTSCHSGMWVCPVGGASLQLAWCSDERKCYKRHN